MLIYLICYKNDVFHFESLGPVVRVGDVNARVGLKPDYIVCDALVQDCDTHVYNPDTPSVRASKDLVSNTRGSRLLDLCKATNMHIANGRLYHDFVVGGYTYYCRNLSSTIDYLILKESDFSCIRNFRICNFNNCSDHASLCFELNANQSYVTIDEHNSEHVGTRYKWNNEKRDTFRSGIIAKLPPV